MQFLLDTHVLIWVLVEPKKLKPSVLSELRSDEHQVFFSAASIWEIAIKAALGRADFPHPVEKILEVACGVGFTELPVRAAVALTVAALPLHHRDPFDRLLVAQALSLPARLLTADAQLRAYSELVTLV